MTQEDKDILDDNDWTLECESPFEIRHESGAFATGIAAQFILDDLKTDEKASALVKTGGILCRCSKCFETFTLSSDRESNGEAYISIRSCESDGIYGCSVTCPHCRYEHELM